MRRVIRLSMISLLVVSTLAGCASRSCRQALSAPSQDVTILTNRDYFPVVHRIFQDAQKSIQVMMFSARYYTEQPSFARETEHVPGTPWSDTNVLLDDLADARKRGLEVQIILDSSRWNQSNTELNEQFGQLLFEQGVPVFMDDPEVTTHCKLLIVDDDLTVVGSTNWSYYALDDNNETSVLIRSQDVNRDYREFFEEVLSNSTPLTVSTGEKSRSEDRE
jgi:phosphatidylserine/phosphatidylglycerophosphate/cardiolipin synthase-like enzyme